MTYDDALSANKDKVRWLIGDTSNSAATELQTDNEIAFALTQHGNQIYRAAAACARAIRGKFARQVSTSVGDVRVEAQQQFAHYTELAKSLERDGARYASATPWMGGVSVADKQSAEADTDRVPPAFSRSTGGVIPGTNETLDQEDAA